MLLEKGKLMMEETRTLKKEEEEILLFSEIVAEPLLEDVKKTIHKEIRNKYGNDGLQFYKSITEDDDDLNDSNVDPGECEECGKISEEDQKDLQERIQLIEVFMDTKYSDIIKEIVGLIKLSPARITDWCIKHEMIRVGLYDSDDMNDIPPEDIMKLKTCILFDGIKNGWLFERVFKK